MAPSEASILSNFLLSPASLPTIISLQQFTELFPKRLRSHPHIRALYRELQQLREQDMDLVNGNIDQELRQGESQKAELRKSILNTGVDGELSDLRYGKTQGPLGTTSEDMMNETIDGLEHLENACYRKS
ncbi:hypothetical protein APSETT444_001489 [Aspergillus pseudonomiae]